MPGLGEEQYRLIMSRLVSGVSVVTSRYRNLDLAMTATSVVSVSLEPPTLLFAVHADARLAEAIEAGAGWAVNILGADGLATADWLASPGRPAVGQLAQVSHERGEYTGAAVLGSAAGWVECETEWVKPAGSHLVVVGQARAGGFRKGATGAVLHAHGRLEEFGQSG